MTIRLTAVAVALLTISSATGLLDAAPSEAQTDFSADPKWEGFRNRLLPASLPKTRQIFGYRPSNFARGARFGEAGGWVQRSITPASCAKRSPPKTWRDRLTASGRFAVINDAGFSGVMLGWFH